MKRIALLFALLLAVMPVESVQSQTQQKDEIVSIRKSELTPQQAASIEQQNMQNKIETYGKWVGLGKEVGEAVNGSLSALSTQADNFAKTGVGKFTMVLVAYKVVGDDILDVLITVPLMIVMTLIFIWSYRKSCMTRSVLKSESKEGLKEYEIINKPITSHSDGDGDLDGRRLWHILIYLVVMAILLAVAVG